MSAMKLPACHFERQAKAARHGGGSIKPALCESAQPGLEIDARTTQDGQPGGILHGVCLVAKRVPREMVRLPHCAAQHKKFTRPKYLCEQALNIDKTRQIFIFFGGVCSISAFC